MKKVLLIAYHYPPMVRVGGRRWHLFVKYLRRKGAHVDVLTCQEGGDATGDFGENLYTVPPQRGPRPPYFKRCLPTSAWQKLPWHLSKWLDRLHSQMKHADDREISVPVSDAFLQRAAALLAVQAYEAVVLTVGPFSYAGILPALKKAAPAPAYILDYRDDWLRDRPYLSPRQRAGEGRIERAALEAADLITTVDDTIAAIIRSAYPALHTPLQVVPHGYDEDDFEGLLPAPPPAEGEKIKLVYGGACYAQVEKYYALLRQFVEAQTHLSLEVDFYFTYLADEVAAEIAPLEPKRILPPVSRREMLRIHMEEADVNLIIYPDYNHNARSSKFYELIRCGKPIWYFGPDGQTASFIRRHHLGLTFTKPSDLVALPPDTCRTPLRALPNLAQHSIPHILAQLEGHVAALPTP